jgi:hypothetical protein
MAQGLVLLSFGKPEYHYMAAHLAMSIKYYNDIPIAFVHDGTADKYIPAPYHRFIDEWIKMPVQDYIRKGIIDPGWAKINLLKHLPFDTNMYLDVDGLALQDLSPLFITDKFFACEVIGSGMINDTIEYSIWATNKDVWQFFQLDPDQSIYRTIQSSFWIGKKGEQLAELHERMVANYDFPPKKITMRWGDTMPDELIFSGTLAQMEHDPNFGKAVVFYGNTNVKEGFAELQAKYSILSMYGNGQGTTLVKIKYKDWYNRICSMMCRKLNLNPIHPIGYLMRSKHANRI